MFEYKNSIMCLGIVSKVAIDVSIDLANESKKAIILIPSRNQIETNEISYPGYATKWGTQEFVTYVRSRDLGKYIVIERDHGGPWQGANEKNLSEKDAMLLAKKSLKSDILSGFDLIHLDVSLDMNGKPASYNDSIIRLFELYHYCENLKNINGLNFNYEVGAEVQSTGIGSPIELNLFIDEIQSFCKANSYNSPSFIVAQVGGKVCNLKNKGDGNMILQNNDIAFKIKQLVDVCDRKNIKIKSHNCDYFPHKIIKKYKDIGVTSINIAPELASFQNEIYYNKLSKNIDLYNDLVIKIKNNKNWTKWFDHTDVDDKKVFIGGLHYIYNDIQTYLDPYNEIVYSELYKYLKSKLEAFGYGF